MIFQSTAVKVNILLRNQSKCAHTRTHIRTHSIYANSKHHWNAYTFQTEMLTSTRHISIFFAVPHVNSMCDSLRNSNILRMPLWHHTYGDGRTHTLTKRRAHIHALKRQHVNPHIPTKVDPNSAKRKSRHVDCAHHGALYVRLYGLRICRKDVTPQPFIIHKDSRGASHSVR